MPPRKPKAILAPADDLKREVQAAFGGLTPHKKYLGGFGRHDGFAYIGAEAYLHLAGCPESGLQPTQLKYRGRSHWWLVDAEGRVIDLVLGPREKSSFPYHRGKRRPFRYTPAGISRAAQEIVERVLQARRAA